ncbi:MipA/OmpV family protein [Telmatospirillum siberiense]|uniref:MipA/OmpV family protein n=1 Tax=Telmatospirillum siberiense TaxID=382514 RepID=UPI0013040411|nr:MipA/OmpV family protein [Telmatospirillum siberiense]
MKAEETLDQQLEQPTDADHPSSGPWNVTLGLGAGYAPRFEGAKRYHFTPIPYGSVSYSGLGSIGPEGLGANIVKSGGFRAGLLVGYTSGRDENDDPHLQGLGNISGSLQMGGYAAYQWQGFEVRTKVLQAVTHSGNGLVGSVGVTYALHPATDWMVKVGPQLSFADSDHMKRYFGVTGTQSRNSGLSTYTANGGLNDISVGANATYQISPHWLLFGIAKVSELVGDAADSPIVQDKGQVFTGAGLAYHF